MIKFDLTLQSTTVKWKGKAVTTSHFLRNRKMTKDAILQAFYSIQGVEFVEYDIRGDEDNRLIWFSVGVDNGSIEAVCSCQEQVDELIDIVDVHQTKAICDKKRNLKVKFISDNF